MFWVLKANASDAVSPIYYPLFLTVSALDVAKAGVPKKKQKGAAPLESTEAPQAGASLALSADRHEPENPTMVALSSGDAVAGDTSPPPEANKKSDLAAAGTGVEKNAKPTITAKRRRKKKWFARKGK